MPCHLRPVRQGSFDFEWGSFLCAPGRSGARAAGEAATGSQWHEVTTLAALAGLRLDGHRHDHDRYERHGHGPARGPWTNLGRLPLRVFSIGKYAFQKKEAWATVRAIRGTVTGSPA